MNALLETIAAELERPRAVSQQVIKHIIGTHDVPREDIGAFLVRQLPTLEDYEVDLVLSPLFTPSLQDQIVFAEILGNRSFASDLWPQTIRQLLERPTVARLITEDGATHQSPLRDVTIERFVLRLRLEGSFPDDVSELIQNLPQSADRSLVRAIARRAIWDHSGRRELLKTFLRSTTREFSAADAVALLKLVETYEPRNTDELLRQIPHWRQVLRQELDAPGVKPFFNERVEELHGGGRDQRRQNDSQASARRSEFEFLGRLTRCLAS